MNAKAVWNGKMKFTGSSGTGHNVVMDASEDNGGDNTAPRPKEMLLLGLAGCTGMDVVSILKKMRIDAEGFRIEVDADQTTEHPMIFKNIHIKYFFNKSVDTAKSKKAVELSQDKYCGVSDILRKSSTLTYEIIYE
jgi:putative redox protein